MPRYYVKEHTGYAIGRPGANASSTRTLEITEVLVLDRDYCHRVVWSSLWQGKRNSRARLPEFRAEAKRLCCEWNAEDRADAA